MTAVPVLARCPWCSGRNRRASDWEQQTVRGAGQSGGEWLRMCRSCATARLKNPFSALLPMRKVTSCTADRSATP